MTNEKSVILAALALLLIGGVFYTIDPTLTGKAYSDQNLQQADYVDQDSVVYAQQDESYQQFQQEDEQQRKEATLIMLQQRAEEFGRPLAVNQPIDEFYMHVLTMTGAMPVPQGTTFADLNLRAIHNIISALDYMITQQSNQQIVTTDDAVVVDITQDQPVIPVQQVVTIIVDDKPASVDADIVIDIISSSDDIDQLVQSGTVIIDPDTGQLEIPQGAIITVSDDGAIQITTSTGQSTVIESSTAASRIEQEVARERIKMATGISLDSYSLSFGKRYDVVTGVSDEPTRTSVLLSERAGTVREEKSAIGNVISALKSLFNPLGIFGFIGGEEPPKSETNDGCVKIQQSGGIVFATMFSGNGNDALLGRANRDGQGFGLGDILGKEDDTPPVGDIYYWDVCRNDGCEEKGPKWRCDPVECRCVESQFPVPTELKCEGSAPATVTYSADSGKVKMDVCQAAKDRAVELCVPQAVSDYRSKAKVACDRACALANSNPACGGKFPPIPKSICQASACTPEGCGIKYGSYISNRCESQAQGQATASITCQCGGASSTPPVEPEPLTPTDTVPEPKPECKVLNPGEIEDILKEIHIAETAWNDGITKASDDKSLSSDEFAKKTDGYDEDYSKALAAAKAKVKCTTDSNACDAGQSCSPQLINICTPGPDGGCPPPGNLPAITCDCMAGGSTGGGSTPPPKPPENPLPAVCTWHIEKVYSGPDCPTCAVVDKALSLLGVSDEAKEKMKGYADDQDYAADKAAADQEVGGCKYLPFIKFVGKPPECGTFYRCGNHVNADSGKANYGEKYNEQYDENNPAHVAQRLTRLEQNGKPK